MVKERQEGKYKSEELLCSSFSQISLIQSTRKNNVCDVFPFQEPFLKVEK